MGAGCFDLQCRCFADWNINEIIDRFGDKLVVEIDVEVDGSLVIVFI